MDLLNEGSTASRILAVRHVSSDPGPARPETNNAINSTVLCHSYSIQPDFHTYFEALQPYVWILWSCGLLELVATFVFYIVTVRSARHHWKQCSINLAIVLSVYPLVSSAAFVATILPRARLLAEAVAQEVVMISMYHLFCMIVAECGGVSQLVRQANGSQLETRTLPCCCWPCCVIPRPTTDKRSLSCLRYLVLQMPIIQGFLYFLILVLWAEDMRLYLQCFPYIQPFIAASILSGVWGIIMCVRAAESAGHAPRRRFLVLQLALIIVKLQSGLGKVIPELASLPCLINLNPSVVTNMIQNSVTMLEMLLLSIWAWHLYRIPPGKDLEKSRSVSKAVLDDNVKTMEIKSADGMDNKSFN